MGRGLRLELLSEGSLGSCSGLWSGLWSRLWGGLWSGLRRFTKELVNGSFKGLLFLILHVGLDGFRRGSLDGSSRHVVVVRWHRSREVGGGTVHSSYRGETALGVHGEVALGVVGSSINHLMRHAEVGGREVVELVDGWGLEEGGAEVLVQGIESVPVAVVVHDEEIAVKVAFLAPDTHVGGGEGALDVVRGILVEPVVLGDEGGLGARRGGGGDTLIIMGGTGEIGEFMYMPPSSIGILAVGE